MSSTDFDAVVIGASGALGAAMVTHLQNMPNCRGILALSRRGVPAAQHPNPKLRHGHIDLTDEASIAAAANLVSDNCRFVFIATGMLHDGGQQPEKAVSALNPAHLAHSFAINATGPALVFKHFGPKLVRQGRAVMAAISAKVGSISDNRLGGWYGYRAAKAALNQFVRTYSIELARTRPEALVLALHPGTFISPLSAPFTRANTPNLVTAEQAAERLLRVMLAAPTAHSGALLDYRGEILAP